MRQTELISQQMDKVKNAAYKSIDNAFVEGQKIGIKKMYLEILKTDIDDVPYPSNIVLQAKNRLLAEIGEKKDE